MATESIAGTAAWLDGVELLNDARTRAYIENGLGPNGLTVACDSLCPDIFEIIGCDIPGNVVLDQYIDLPGTVGDKISTPDPLSITGDIEITARVSLDDWTPVTFHSTVVSQFNTAGNQISWAFQVSATSGTLRFDWTPTGDHGGFLSFQSTVGTGLVDGTVKWIKVTFDVDDGSGNRVGKFYTSDDGVVWTQLGTTITTAGVTSLFNSTAKVVIGGRDENSNPLSGNVYYVEIRSGIGGTIVASFDANDTPATSATTPNTVTSSQTGEVWTINGSGWSWGGGAYTYPYYPLDGQSGYVSPLADGASWISASYPESRDFLGLLVSDFEGLGSTLTRNVSEVLNEGAILGRLRAAHRTLSWKAYLVGRTCCSVAYGLRWLTRQLSGPSACAGSCTTSTLDLITCCPEFPDSDPSDDETVTGLVGGGYGGTIFASPSYGGPDQTVTATEGIFPVQESVNNRAFRTLYNVGLIEGPLITDQVRIGCGCGCSEIMQVEFTLVAGKPYLYQNAITIVESQPLVFGVPTTAPELTDCVLNDCVTNPACPPPTTPPLPVLTDNCYVAPVSPTATRISVPRSYWPDMADVVPIITIYSGTSPLTSTTIDFYETVSGDPCGELVGLGGLLCNPACGTLRIPYIPADSMFVIDGRINKMSVICPLRSNIQPGEKLTSGEWGWPVFSCYGFCFELITDQDILSAGATVSFEIVPRSL